MHLLRQLGGVDPSLASSSKFHPCNKNENGAFLFNPSPVLGYKKSKYQNLGVKIRFTRSCRRDKEEEAETAERKRRREKAQRVG